MTMPEADVLPETFNFSAFELSYLSTLQPPHSSLSLLVSALSFLTSRLHHWF